MLIKIALISFASTSRGKKGYLYIHDRAFAFALYVLDFVVIIFRDMMVELT